MTTQIYGRSPSIAVNKDIVSVSKKIYGLNYPLEKNPKRGYFSKQSGVTLVKNNLRQLLQTIKGERVMLPDYGANLQNYLFQPLDKFTIQNIKNEILHAISLYAPGVQVTRLQVFSSDSVTSEGYQGILINLFVQVEELGNQEIDLQVEVG